MRLSPREPAWPAPRILGRWQTWLVLMAVLVVPFFVPIPVMARRNVLVSTLGDRLHIVLPACIMLMLYWKGPLRGNLWIAAVATALVGGAIEFIQPFFDRTPLLHDWLLDLVGVGMVLGWVGWRGHRRRSGLVLITALLVFTAWGLRSLPGRMVASADARKRFPVIENFEDGHVWNLWSNNDSCELHMPREAAFDGRRGLRLVGGPPEHWPGATMRRFPHDWRGFAALELKVRTTTPGRDAVRFHVRLDDFAGTHDHEWVTTSFTATPVWKTVTVPLVDRTTDRKGRPFDVSDVDAITIFLSRPDAPTTIEIDDIRLVR
ncbi:MAG TPA: carbohydrate binding domain-containing protein [Candidatus Krumholzibacteria bacterium]|nr:carbohydrate binding domain-containing protein [Candidatus Krumholzibacteria bacterium]